MASATSGRRRGHASSHSLSLYLKDAVDDDPFIGKPRLLNFRSWTTIKTIKDELSSRLHIPTGQQRLFFRGKELKNKYSLQDCGVYRNGDVLQFSVRPTGEQNPLAASNCFLESYSAGTIKCPKSLRRAMLQAKRAMHLGLVPSLALEGTGGTYFLPNSQGTFVACFKPQDEEAFAVNNPRGSAWGGAALPGNDTALSVRHGIRPGEACVREVAAYVLDKKSFAGVPETTLVECAHAKFSYHDRRVIPKLGSLQTYIPSVGVAEDFSCSTFPAAQVHKVAMLDIRLLNCDRNAANLLIRDGQRGHVELVPVDHGFCLPDVLNIGWCDWCWLDWPQVKEPLDEETARYIREDVDPERDVEVLRQKLSLPEPCLVLVRMAGMLLKTGVEAGLTLHEVASLVVRHDLESSIPSQLELAHRRAHQLAQIATSSVRYQSPAVQNWSAACASRIDLQSQDPVSVGREDVNSLNVVDIAIEIQECQKSCDEENDVVRAGRTSPLGFWQERGREEDGLGEGVGEEEEEKGNGMGGAVCDGEEHSTGAAGRHEEGGADEEGFDEEEEEVHVGETEDALQLEEKERDEVDPNQTTALEDDAGAPPPVGLIRVMSCPALGDASSRNDALSDEDEENGLLVGWVNDETPTPRRSAQKPHRQGDGEEFREFFWRFADALVTDLVRRKKKKSPCGHGTEDQ